MESLLESLSKANAMLYEERLVLIECLDWMIKHREHESKEYLCTCARCIEMDGTIAKCKVLLDWLDKT